MEAKQVRSLMEAYASVYEEHDNETIVEMDERSPEYNRKKQEEAKAAAHRARTRGGAGGAAKPRTPITAGGGAPEEHGQVERYRQMAIDRARQNQRSGGAGRSVQQNSVDLFDIVKGYLIDEGHADSEEEALHIMANMTEESRTEIVDFVESMASANRMKEIKEKGFEKSSTRSMSDQVTDALPWNRNTKYTTKGELRKPGENVHGQQTGKTPKRTSSMGAK